MHAFHPTKFVLMWNDDNIFHAIEFLGDSQLLHVVGSGYLTSPSSFPHTAINVDILCCYFYQLGDPEWQNRCYMKSMRMKLSFSIFSNFWTEPFLAKFCHYAKLLLRSAQWVGLWFSESKHLSFLLGEYTTTWNSTFHFLNGIHNVAATSTCHNPPQPFIVNIIIIIFFLIT